MEHKGRFARLRGLPRPQEGVFWVETTEEGLFFVDAVLMSQDGVANVRREYREEGGPRGIMTGRAIPRGGRKFFKVYVPPGLADEALALLERLRRYVPIGEIRPG